MASKQVDEKCVEEEYDLDYDDDSSEPDAELENQYHNSKALKENDPALALVHFTRVVELEGAEKGEWGFKALKQMVKINFVRGNFKEAISRYKQFLTYVQGTVTRNKVEKCIDSLLRFVYSSNSIEFSIEFYEITLDIFKEAKNDSLCYKINKKLSTLYFEKRDLEKLAETLKHLHATLKTENDEQQLLQVYLLEMQIYVAQKKYDKFKNVHKKCMEIAPNFLTPLAKGTIKECFGRMNLQLRELTEAHHNFLEAFQNYDSAGSLRRITCLKYLVLVILSPKRTCLGQLFTRTEDNRDLLDEWLQETESAMMLKFLTYTYGGEEAYYKIKYLWYLLRGEDHDVLITFFTLLNHLNENHLIPTHFKVNANEHILILNRLKLISPSLDYNLLLSPPKADQFAAKMIKIMNPENVVELTKLLRGLPPEMEIPVSADILYNMWLEKM